MLLSDEIRSEVSVPGCTRGVRSSAGVTKRAMAMRPIVIEATTTNPRAVIASANSGNLFMGSTLHADGVAERTLVQSTNSGGDRTARSRRSQRDPPAPVPLSDRPIAGRL